LLLGTDTNISTHISGIFRRKK